jgi:hypothetical protein
VVQGPKHLGSYGETPMGSPHRLANTCLSAGEQNLTTNRPRRWRGAATPLLLSLRVKALGDLLLTISRRSVFT